jgi:catechol 2,3-dioxygenase-like lactoylglutathione lyase family enzyme
LGPAIYDLGVSGDEADVPRAHGLGGVFFRCDDPAATRAWYQEHLGMTMDEHGTSFAWRRDGEPKQRGFTLWSPFGADSEYFGDLDQQFMINLRVDDLDGVLARLRAAGVEVADHIDEQPFGRFTHLIDNDGRRVELWEPIDTEYEDIADGITPS